MIQNIETKKKAFANSYQELYSKRQRKRLYKAVFALILSQSRSLIKNGAVQMEKFRYGKIYIVERTETTLQAFEMTLRGKDFIEIYVREYTPATNQLIGYEVRLHVSNDGFQEFVNYKKDIPASRYYDGKISIYTREGLNNYDEKANS